MSHSGEQEKYYKAPDYVSISYYIRRCRGEHPALVMLHGLASNHSRWSEFISHTALVEHMQLLRLDLRGHGSSITQGRFNHNVWVQDIHQILQNEALEKVYLLGHSMGAQLAMHYATTYPAQTDGLILIDPTFPEDIKGVLALARRLRFPLSVVISLLITINRIFPSKKRYPARDLFELDTKTRELMKSQSPEIIADLYMSPKEDMKYISLLNYLQDVYATTAPLPDLHNLNCPVKILLSKSSSIVAANNIRRYFPDKIKVEITDIDANHWPLTEKPVETRIAIDNWCRQQLTAG